VGYLKKEAKKQLLRVYNKMDGLAEYSKKKHNEDIVKLHQVATQKEFLDTLKPGTGKYEIAYSHLLELSYQYYQVTGELPKELLPKDVNLSMLIESYHQTHKDAFNMIVQNQIHAYLVNTVPLLKQLQQTAQVGPTIDQYADVRLGFQQQLRFLLSHGFALDLKFYRAEIEPVWLILKVARKLTANDFKPIVRVLDRYSRLQTGNESKVLYHADDAHTAKKDPVKPTSKEDQVRHDKEVELRKSRLGINDNRDGQMVVKLHSSEK
jgi:hypothetical protein